MLIWLQQIMIKQKNLYAMTPDGSTNFVTDAALQAGKQLNNDLVLQGNLAPVITYRLLKLVFLLLYLFGWVSIVGIH